MQPVTIDLPAGVASCAAKKAARYAITGVEVRQLSEHELAVTATDRHSLTCIVTRHDGGTVPTTLVPAELLNGSPARVVLSENECRVQAIGKTGTLKGHVKLAPPTEGTFPPVSGVIPKLPADAVPVITVDVNLLARVAAALAPDDGVVSLFLNPDGPTRKPICVMARGSSNIAVLMPCAPPTDPEFMTEAWNATRAKVCGPDPYPQVPA